jgi:AmiR/NasT family two-component response regulator
MAKPKCKLIGEDGNIFNLMGIASKTLKRAGLEKEANEMKDKITKSKSYNEALAIIMDYVEVE